MKKQYIQPESHIVVVRLMGSVLQTAEMNPLSNGTGALGARQSDNSFSWDDEEDEIEGSMWK